MTKNTRFGWLVVGLFAFSVVLSGCNDLSTPQGVIGSAVTSLKKEKVKQFKRTLRGEALERYGNLIGMAELLKVLQAHEFTLGEVKLLEERRDRLGDPEYRLFSVELNSAQKTQSQQPHAAPLSAAKVECDVIVTYTGFLSGMDRNCYMTPNGTICVPSGGYNGPIQRHESQRCYIIELN